MRISDWSSDVCSSDLCCGLTAAVGRPTVRADELSRHEFIAASARLEQKIERYSPRYIAFLGKAAYSVIAGQRTVQWGPQSTAFAGSTAWVLPNHRGLNPALRLDAPVTSHTTETSLC